MKPLKTAAIVALAACRFDPSYRDVAEVVPIVCREGEITCGAGALTRCVQNAWAVIDDCAARSLVCAQTLLACTPCIPNASGCDGQTITACSPDGQITTRGATCEPAKGEACRDGTCRNLCADADLAHSNIGCEYWGADLDNAVVSATGNAASQQYAIVVSNAEADVATDVTIEQDDSGPGDPAAVRTLAKATILAGNLEVFRLGPREVDGSPEGEFNTGSHTALTRHAFRVRATMPVVAYQFNPLENVSVFSNDASQLLPTSALSGPAGPEYVVAGWPQTIASSSNPSQNFGVDLRAFVAVIATRPNTHVHLDTTARIVPGGPLAQGLEVGQSADVLMQPFDVLNLETGDFNADFTGSRIKADQPVAVFPGSEASDAPFFSTLADRYCCADHLEDQLTPLRAVGKSYSLARMPNRSRAVLAAGGNIGAVDETEYFRVVAVAPGVTHVKTTLPAPNNDFDLTGPGADRVLAAKQDFLLSGTLPVLVEDVQASQDSAGVPRGLPGGDPSITFVAPVEQWRNDYVLLTPDKYNFDFLVISARYGSHVFIDGISATNGLCDVAPGDGLTPAMRGKANPNFVAYRCQLSYPVIDPTKAAPDNVKAGAQHDGVHRVQADQPVGVVVYGFDSYVSYAYAGGTQLTEINTN